MNLWSLVSRHLPDILALYILWRLLVRKKRTKKQRRKFLQKVFLPRLAIALAIVYIVVPVGIGAFYRPARYFPQLLEAHRLALYHRPFTWIPTVGASPTDIRKLATDAARDNDLDPALVRAVIATESSGRQFAISNVGACGLMQLMPNTYFSLRGANPFIARENIRAGSRYLREMLDMFDGNVNLALAAYNAGPGNVRRRGGVPPGGPSSYVRKVRSQAARYRAGS